MFGKILHANDGSDSAFTALRRGLELAQKAGGELHMVSVEELRQFPEIIGEVTADKAAADRRYREVVARAGTLAAERGVKLHVHVVTGHPVRTIVDLVDQIGADLLVIGATGHSSMFGPMIGSRAARMVDLASCSVLVVK